MSDFDAEAQVAQPVAPPPPRRTGISSWTLHSAIRTLRVVNFFNAVLIVLLYPLYLVVVNVEEVFSVGFLAVYCVLFGCVLMCFECNLEAAELRLRKHVGFLFSYRGRTLFIAFLATLCFAAQWVVGYVIGGLTLANAVFNCLVIYTHPQFSGGRVKGGSWDPTIGYSRGSAEAARLGRTAVQQNPELARKAVSATVHAGAQFARDNPDLARQAAQEAVRSQTSDGFDVSRA